MAGKQHTLSKKTIIAIVTVIVLLFIAGLSVGIFLSGRGETEAADGNQTGNQVTDGNQTSDGDQTTGGDNNTATDPNTGDSDNQNQNPVTPDDGTDNNVAGADNAGNDNTNNNNANNNGANNNNGNANNGANNNGNANNGTTDTDINDVGETVIERVEEQERLVSKDYWDWWTPTNVAVASTAGDVEPVTPDFEVKKSAITGVGGDKFVYAGQEITYVIEVTNNGDTDLNEIEITDKIPQNTTFVSIDDVFNKVEGTEITAKGEDGKDTVVGVKWVVSIPNHQSVMLKFTVKVNETMQIEDEEGNKVEVPTEGTIKNAVIANGEESETVETSIITNNKSSVLMRKNEITGLFEDLAETEKTAKLGDRVRYIITVTNTGDAEGSTYINDTIPAGTKLVSIDGNEVSEDSNTIEIGWSITLGANESVSKEFVVEIVDIDGEIKNIGDVGGTPTNPDVVETGDIDVEKTVSEIETTDVDGKKVVIKDAEELANYEVKVGDVIKYAINVTNKGSLDLTNVVVDEKLEGLKIVSLIVDGKVQAIEFDEAGRLVIGDLRAAKEATDITPEIAAGKAEIIATYTVDYDKDINGKPEQIIENKVEVTGETKPTDPEKEPEEVEDEDKVETPVEDVKALNADKIVTSTGTGKDGAYKLGEFVDYKVTVTNIGNEIVEGIKITDTINAGTDAEVAVLKADRVDAEGNVIEKDVDLATYTFTLASGESTYFVYSHEVTEQDIKLGTVNNAVVAEAPETEPGTDTETEEPEDPSKKLEADKIVTSTGTGKDGAYKLGEFVDYRVTVTNIGNQTVEGIKVKDTINAGTDAKVDVLTANRVDEEGKVIVANVDLAIYTFELAPGESAYFTYSHEVTEQDITLGTIKNAVVAEAPGTEPGTDTEIEEPEDPSKKLEADKIVTSTGTGKDGAYKLGEFVDYKVTVTNIGNQTVEGIKVKDTINAGTDAKVDVLKADRVDAEGNVIEKDVDLATYTFTLAIDESAYFTYSHEVTEQDIKLGTIVNAVVAEAPGTEPGTDTEIEEPEDPTKKLEADKIVTSVGTGVDGAYKLGEFVDYKVTVTNIGNQTIEGIKVKDTINAGTDAKVDVLRADRVDAEGNVIAKDVDLATYTFTLGINESAYFTYSHEVTEQDIKLGTIKNAVVAEAPGTEPGTDTEIEEPEDPSKKLIADKVVTSVGTGVDGTYKLGEFVDYKVTVTNKGNQTIEGIKIKDTINAGTDAKVDVLRADRVDAEGNVIAKDIDLATYTFTLAVDESAYFTYSHEVTEHDITLGTIKNAVVAEAPGTEPGTDTEIEEPEDPSKKLEADKIVTSTGTGKDGAYKLGEFVDYKVTVTNIGNQTIEGIKVKDTINGGTDAKVDVLKADRVDAEGNVIEKDVDLATYTFTLGINESAYFTYSHKVTEQDIKLGTIVNAVVAEAPGTEPGTDTETEEPEDPTKILVADKKEYSTPASESGKYVFGEAVEYMVTVTNTGNQTVQQAKITDVVNDNTIARVVTEKATIVDKDGNPILDEDGNEQVVILANYTFSLAPGESAYFKYSHVVTEEDIKVGTIINNVTATGEDGTTPGGGEETVDPEDPTKILDVNKAVLHEKPEYKLGENVEYLVTVTNEGNQTVEGIILSDKVNNTTSITTVTEVKKDGTVVAIRDLRTHRFSLAPGASAYFKYTYTVTEADIALGEVTNIVTVTAPGANTDTDTETVDPEDSIPLTNVTLVKGVAEKQADGTFRPITGAELTNKRYAIGDSVWYSITVTNNHVAPGSITVTDQLPKGIKFVEATENVGTPTYNADADKYTVTWEVTDLAAGASRTIYIKGTITENAISGMKPTNTTVTETEKTELYKVANIAVTENTSSEVDITVEDKTELTSKTVIKEWRDNQNEDVVRPISVTVQLLANGVDFGDAVELNVKNGWKHTWSELIKKDDNGTDIVYTVKETKVGNETVVDNKTSNYITSQVTNPETGVVTITNTYDPEVKGTKIATTTENGNVVGTITAEEGKNVVSTGNTAVQIGDVINYTIKLENKSYSAKTVTVGDTIPAHTALVENTTVYLDGKALTATELQQFYARTLKVTVPEHSTRNITFSVKVISGNAGDEVRNTAFVDERPVGPTVNPIEKLVSVTKYKNNIASTNIVLVLDTSLSMQYRTDADKDPIGTQQSRIEVAIDAIKEFVTNTYKIDKNADVTFSLVTFNSRYEDRTKLFTFNDGTNSAAWIATKDTQAEFTKGIENLKENSLYAATNIGAGLKKADETIDKLIAIDKYKNFDKIMIFFGDGKPQETDNQWNTATQIAEIAKGIRDKGTKIYSIGFGPSVKPDSTDKTGYRILSSISSDGAVYNSDNYGDLIRDFSKIAGRDPSYDTITVDGSAIINITSNAQNIVVDSNNPIVITVDGVTTTITSVEQAAANHITFTNKNITWDVSGYRENATLAITYYVQ